MAFKRATEPHRGQPCLAVDPGSLGGACHNFRMPGADSLPAVVTGGAFLLGIVFGAVGQRVNFCTMGAIADAANFGDWRRMRMWALAIAVAIAGAAALQAAGLDRPRQVDLHGRRGSRGCR